jgi:hypothetical protein
MTRKNNIPFFLLLILLSFNIYSQEKTFLDYMNEMTATFPGCENTFDKDECFRRSVGEIILNDFNNPENLKITKSIKNTIEIKLLIRCEVSGETTILEINSKIKEVDSIVNESLKKLPQIQPIVSQFEPKTSSIGFYVILEKNSKTNLFELVFRKGKTDLSKMPSPNQNKLKHVEFKNCENKNNGYDCFIISFKKWLSENLNNKIESIENERFFINISIDKKGNLEKKTFNCQSEDLKIVLEEIFENFPKLKPAEMNGEKIKMSYSITIN